MRSTLATAIVAAISTTAPHHIAAQKHHPGCNTRRCDRHIDRLWARRHRTPSHFQLHPNLGSTAIASWFDDSGGTACGTHYALGVANKELACGTRVELCANRCATVVVEDRGPFIAGRTWDLNPGAKTALGCGDICAVSARVMR
jgi:hypothetical protein